MEIKCAMEISDTYAPASTSQSYTQDYAAASMEDKDMANGWSFNWASMATKGKESLEARRVESVPVVSVLCVYAAFNRGARRNRPAP